MIILGIDPGIARTGYGVLKLKSKTQWLVLDYGCIETSAKTVFSERLSEIYHSLRDIIKKYKPEKIAIEKIYFAKNAKTAIKVGEARGVILLASNQKNILISEFTPLQVKQALTGYGQASKEQVQKMVKIVLNLDKIPKPDDAADALAIAVTCAQSLGIENKTRK